MNFLKLFDRINRIHRFILSESTGNPDSFAKKLDISRRQLYYELESLKDLSAKVKYCKKRETFYYEVPFVLELNHSNKKPE
jgi:transcriptional antiterminator